MRLTGSIVQGQGRKGPYLGSNWWQCKQDQLTLAMWGSVPGAQGRPQGGDVTVDPTAEEM